MPITFQIDPVLRLVEVRITGDVSTADLRASTEEILAHPLFGTDLRFLGDISGLVPRFTSGDLVLYHEWRRERPKFAKMAIVASTDYEFGLARQFELTTNAVGGAEMHVFKSVKDAREWLGISPLKPK